MTVGELIAKLQEFDPNLPVALGDWNEGYLSPAIHAVNVKLLTDAPVDDHEPPEGFVRPQRYGPGVEYAGTYVCIGSHNLFGFEE